MGWIQVDRFRDDGVSFTFNVVGSTGRTLVQGLTVKDDEVVFTEVPDGPPVSAKYLVKDGKCELLFNNEDWQRIKSAKVHEKMVEELVRAMGSSDGGFMD